MRKKVMSLLLLVLVTTGAAAQTRQRESLTDSWDNRRAEVIVRDLQLDDETKAWFVPLYKEFRDTLRAIKPPTRMGRGKRTMTEEECARRIETLLEAREKATALKRAYYLRFKEKLTSKQILYFFFSQDSDGRDRRPMRAAERRAGNLFGGSSDTGNQ